MTLRVHYAFMHSVDLRMVAAKLPGIKISVKLIDDEYFRLDTTGRHPLIIHAQSRGFPTDLSKNRLQLIDYTLGARSSCQWSTKVTPQIVPVECDTLVFQCDLKSHGEEKWTHTQLHLNDLVKDTFIPSLKACMNCRLRKIVLPAEILYGRSSLSGLCLPSVEEVVIQSDVAVANKGVANESKFEAFLSALPNLQTLIVCDNFLINWSSIQQLPCRRLSTLVIRSASSRGDQTDTMKAIMELVSGCKYLKVVLIKLAGCVDSHSLNFKSFPKSLNDVFIWAEDFPHLTLERAATAAASVKSLFLYNRSEGKMFVHRNVWGEKVIEDTCIPTRFYRYAMDKWPQFFGVFWRHLLTLSSNYALTVQKT